MPHFIGGVEIGGGCPKPINDRGFNATSLSQPRFEAQPIVKLLLAGAVLARFEGLAKRGLIQSDGKRTPSNDLHSTFTCNTLNNASTAAELPLDLIASDFARFTSSYIDTKESEGNTPSGRGGRKNSEYQVAAVQPNSNSLQIRILHSLYVPQEPCRQAHVFRKFPVHQNVSERAGKLSDCCWCHLRQCGLIRHSDFLKTGSDLACRTGEIPRMRERVQLYLGTGRAYSGLTF